MLFKKKEKPEYINTYRNIDIYRINKNHEAPFFMYKLNNKEQMGEMDYIIRCIDHLYKQKELDEDLQKQKDFYRFYDGAKENERKLVDMVFRGIEIRREVQLDGRNYSFKFLNYKRNCFENFKFYDIDHCTKRIDELFVEFENEKYEEFKCFYMRMMAERNTLDDISDELKQNPQTPEESFLSPKHNKL